MAGGDAGGGGGGGGGEVGGGWGGAYATSQTAVLNIVILLRKSCQNILCQEWWSMRKEDQKVWVRLVLNVI